MHDFVIVGGGGSGIPLAVRLAQAGASVLLLEKGTADVAGLADRAHSPLRVPGAMPGHESTAVQEVQLTDGRPWHVPRGRVLGGSTAVNGGYFIRARRADFERWAGVGGDAWRFDAALPLLRRLEADLVHGSTDVHGGSGPMPVGRSSLEHPAAAGLVAAAESLGIAREDDKNDQQPPGVGAVPTNVDEVRVSTALGYLGGGVPAGLEVRGRTRALRVRLEHGRALGVETDRGFIPASRVVLTAGAAGSARILLHSGVGPAADLARWGVPVTADLPVGQAASDHPQAVVDWPVARSFPTPQSWLGAAVHSTSPGAAHEGNVELLQSLLPMTSLMAGTTASPGLTLIVADLTPTNRGTVRLAAADPYADLEIDLGYLRHESDHAPLRHGVRMAAALLSSGAFEIATPPADLAPVLDDDRALDAWIADRLGTAMHLCSTAPMGTVVDGRGAVLGVDGLHVADTSILPTAPLRGPANTAVLIGELIADQLTSL